MAFWSTLKKLVFAVALLACIGHVHALTSAKGCTCTSGCTPSFDDSRPWCYTANSCGSYAYSRARYYDYCTPPPSSPPPAPSSSSSSVTDSDGNQYHRCYQSSTCNNQCSNWAQCTYNPFGDSCRSSSFAYSCDFLATSCTQDTSGYFGYCPPNTVFNRSPTTCPNASFPYGCVPAAPPIQPPPAPPVVTSVRGCTCTSDCGPSFDDSRPWCYTANSCGSYAYSRARYYDYCSLPPPPPSPSPLPPTPLRSTVPPPPCTGNYSTTVTSGCSSNNNNPNVVGPSLPTAATPTPRPSLPPATTPANTCPAATTATSCYEGLTGPPAIIAALRRDPDFTASSRSPPVAENVPPGYYCFSQLTPCSSFINGFGFSPAQCPPGQFLTAYTNARLSNCVTGLSSLLSNPAYKDVTVYACGTTNCRVPSAGELSLTSGAAAGVGSAAGFRHSGAAATLLLVAAVTNAVQALRAEEPREGD